jgi:hypothetical protein
MQQRFDAHQPNDPDCRENAAFLLAVLSLYVYYKHPGRVEKALQLGFIDYQLDVSNEMLWEMENLL